MSETKISMWATILGNVVNVILELPICIRNMDFFRIGVWITLIGTIVSRFIMLALHALRRKWTFRFEGFFLYKKNKKKKSIMII
jgi:MATE family multidrug resistance protein